MTIPQFAVIIERGRKLYYGTVISWGRSKLRNDHVGGNRISRHLRGFAVDMEFYNEHERDKCFKYYYSKTLHGYKKGPYRRNFTVEGKRKSFKIWALHIQDRSAKPPKRA